MPNYLVRLTNEGGDLVYYLVIAPNQSQAKITAWQRYRELPDPDGQIPPKWTKAAAYRMPLTLADIQTEADEEGWAIFECNSTDKRGNYTPYQLCKCDDSDAFVNDDYAWIHVVTRAREGSLLHQQALAWLRINSPTEYTQIVKFVK